MMEDEELKAIDVCGRHQNHEERASHPGMLQAMWGAVVDAMKSLVGEEDESPKLQRSHRAAPATSKNLKPSATPLSLRYTRSIQSPASHEVDVLSISFMD